jgi:glutamate-ammonia-ligase adenylyltransferase
MTSELASAVAQTPDPAAARHAIERLTSEWPPVQEPLARGLEALEEMLPAFLHLLSISPISTEKLIRDPALLSWLAAPNIRSSDRGPRRMLASLREIGWPPPEGVALKADGFIPLRLWKQRETFRIALRDVAGVAPVEQTILELSSLAEVCVREVARACMQDLTRRLGPPGTGFCILGMGKFGAQELNFSSDIDVVFLYDEPGELASGLSRQEFFTRLAQRIIEVFSATSHAGALFRIDLRLRPEGDGGPLVRTLDGTEDYYAAFGETWERMALSKARLVAGDEELGYEFFQRLQAFIYPRSVSHDMVDEVAHMKGRIERELLGPERMHRDVKLGRGGIREIEFICQSLQLLHGARHAFLQERQTLKALRGLRELEYLGAPEVDALVAAYRLLRTVEHRLQIENEAQTHTLPESREALERLERSLQANLDPAADPADALLTTLRRHMDSVRAVFERVMRGDGGVQTAPPDLSFFADPDAAKKNLEDLGEGGGRALISPRTRRLFGRLAPPLVETLQTVADPDAALTRMVRFTERYGSRGALFETLLVNPRVLELLVKLFDASAFLSEIAIRRPQLVEEVARLGNLGERLEVSDHLAGLAKNDERLPWADWVRVYRRAQQLRIGLRDLLGFADLQDVWFECSALAEACLLFTARQLGSEEKLTIIALGKFGGRELGYGADLDLLLIGPDAGAAADLSRAMNESSSEGRAFSVDVRLRPEGLSGQLAVSLREWQDYFDRGRGHLWEVQALTKARPLSGAEQETWLAAAQEIWREHGRRADLHERIREMLQRIAAHRGGDPLLDIKTGQGGLMALEFYVQARQMELGMWEPHTLSALEQVAPPERREPLTDSYLFLRKIETVLRRMDDTPVSRVPADELGQKRLAIRCGLSSRAELIERIRAARETIGREAQI